MPFHINNCASNSNTAYYIYYLTVMGNYRPIYHVIWHLCVLVASLINWFDIYFHVVTDTSLIKPAVGVAV